MKTLKIIPQEGRNTPGFIEFRKALSRLNSLEENPDHDPVDARLAMDEMCEAWLRFRGWDRIPPLPKEPSIDEV